MASITITCESIYTVRLDIPFDITNWQDAISTVADMSAAIARDCADGTYDMDNTGIVLTSSSEAELRACCLFLDGAMTSLAQIYNFAQAPLLQVMPDNGFTVGGV